MEVVQNGSTFQSTLVASSNVNNSNNNSHNAVIFGDGGGGGDDGFGDESKLIKLASASSCYSAGPHW